MLVTLNISNWGATQIDRKKSVEITKDENAQQDAGRWETQLISKKDLEGVQTAVNRARAVHNGMTLPWNDSGTRILPSVRFFEYREAMKVSEAEWQKEVDKLFVVYPTLIADLTRRLGGLKANAKIPTLGELKAKFRYSYSFCPLPDHRDFRTDLQDDAAEEIRKNIEGALTDKLRDAVGDIYKRLSERIKLIAERTKDPDAKLYSSVFDAVKGLAADIPKMNITGDKELEALGKEIASKLSVDPADLRDVKTKRAQVAKDASAILKRMESYTGQVAPVAQQPSQPASQPAKTAAPTTTKTTKPAPKPIVVKTPTKKGPAPKPMTAAEIAKQVALAS